MSSTDMAEEQRRFDALSARIAAAMSAGDELRARRLGDEAVGSVLLPSASRLLRTYSRHANHYEDFVGEALRRIWADWRKGKQVTWASLKVIYTRAALDVLAAHDRHADRSVAMAEGSDAEFDGLLHAASSHAASTMADGVLARLEVERFIAHLNELEKPAWAAYAAAWSEGHRKAPDISDATGVSSGRVRQIRMELCAYVRSYRPELAAWLDAETDDVPQETSR